VQLWRVDRWRQLWDRPLTTEELETERPLMEAYMAYGAAEQAKPGWSAHDPIEADDWPLELRARRWIDSGGRLGR
jgi:hypothetical protein